MDLSKYYKQAIIPPSIIVFTLIIIYSIIDRVNNGEYKSEWLDNNSLYIILFIMILVNTLIFAILLLPLFLNKIKNINENRILNFLSWLLAPSIWVAYILAKHIRLILYTKQFQWEETIFISIMIIPFMIAIIVSFIKFKKEQKRNIHLN